MIRHVRTLATTVLFAAVLGCSSRHLDEETPPGSVPPPRLQQGESEQIRTQTRSEESEFADLSEADTESFPRR